MLASGDLPLHLAPSPAVTHCRHMFGEKLERLLRPVPLDETITVEGVRARAGGPFRFSPQTLLKNWRPRV